MNKIILIGRITRDLEIKHTASQKEVCSFTVAVDRKFKKDGEKTADFIGCVAWGQQATFLGQYFQKGSRVAIIGNLQCRSYDDANGKKIYVSEVVCDEIEFVDSKRDGAQATAPTNPPAPSVDSGFYPEYDDQTTLPFDL